MARPTTHTRTFVRENDEELNVRFEFTPGTPESGVSGPPENYDPGSGPEIYVLAATSIANRDKVLLTREEEDRFATETMEDSEFDPLPERYDA